MRATRESLPLLMAAFFKSEQKQVNLMFLIDELYVLEQF